MTPQEALAQALMTTHVVYKHMPEHDWRNRERVDGMSQAVAAALLAALPEGWYLAEMEAEVADRLLWEKIGAQQERERLRALLEAAHLMHMGRSYATPRSADCGLCGLAPALITDPEGHSGTR